MRRFVPPLLALAVLACSDDDGRRSEPTEDAGVPETGKPDARAPSDAGSRPDARAPLDAAARDAGLDAQLASDAQRPRDAEPPTDAEGLPDAQLPEAGRVPSFEPMPDAPALSYLGTNGNDATCSREFRTMGYTPPSAGQHPLFLYFIGTQAVAQDQSSYYDSQAPRRVTEAMARRGFVALSVEYDNQLGSYLADKTQCLYQDPAGLLQKACALPSVDCSLGIATWGHSQGALIAHSAANFDARVRAVWTTGYGGLDGAKLAPERLRVVNGENDPFNAPYATLNKTAGTTCSDGDSCLRSDGSGWILVRKSDSAENSADHCWFDKRSCSENTLNLEPNWVEPSSDAAFALEANADWVAATVARN